MLFQIQDQSCISRAFIFLSIPFNFIFLVLLSCPKIHACIFTDKKSCSCCRGTFPPQRRMKPSFTPSGLVPWDANHLLQREHVKVTRFTVNVIYATLVCWLLWKCNKSSSAIWTLIQLKFTYTKSPYLSSMHSFKVSGTNLCEDHSWFPGLDFARCGYLRNTQYSS